MYFDLDGICFVIMISIYSSKGMFEGTNTLLLALEYGAELVVN